MSNRFKVCEACNGFYLKDLITKRIACLGDGVDLILGTEDNPLTCETPGFEESWTEDANLCFHTYFEAYFSDLYDLEIYDLPEFADRYTVILEKVTPQGRHAFDSPNLHECLSLSKDPDHPQGVSMWGYADPEFVAEQGRRVFFLDLPPVVQAHIAHRLKE